MRLHFENWFHNRESNCNAKVTTKGYKISKRVAFRIQNQLCGMPDCVCGGDLNANNIADGDGNKYEITYFSDRAVYLNMIVLDGNW